MRLIDNQAWTGVTWRDGGYDYSKVLNQIEAGEIELNRNHKSTAVIKEALNKQIGLHVNIVNNMCQCPVCDRWFEIEEQNYCDNCGQRIYFGGAING